MRAPSPAFRRYLLLELPGWVVAATAVWALVEYAGLDARFGAGLVTLWVAKDFVLFPWLRQAYEPGDPHPSATLAGRSARVTTRLDPGGYVQLGSERWRAELVAGAAAEAGEEVVVLEVEGLTLKVERGG
ncbi:MAG: NfeD family protein [Myxococcota bacterium]